MKKIISFLMCAMMALSVVSGIGVQGTSFDMAVTASAAQAKTTVLGKKKTELLPYYYQKMTEKEQANYLKIREAVMNQKSSLKLGKMSEETLSKLVNTAYYYDCLTFNLEGVQFMIGPSSTELYLDYWYNKESAVKMLEQVDKKADAIIAKFDEDTSTYTKIKYIHDYIIKVCTYDKEAKTAGTAYGALIAKKAKCDGYSHAFAYICRKAGIYTVNVTGYAGEDHMWNKVYYNKKWYNVDVTWDDPESPLKDNLSYNYFMISDAQISKTHRANEIEFNIPAAKSSSRGYYTMYKLTASDTKEAKSLLISKIASAASKGKASVTIQMKDAESYQNLINYLYKNNSEAIFDILKSASKKTKAKLLTGGYLSQDDENSRTFTIYFYTKGSKISDYYTSAIDESTKNFLKQLGLKD